MSEVPPIAPRTDAVYTVAGTGGAEGPWRNRLVHELSPYLRQHAHNPVDWYPWGDAAFDRARTLDRPVLLSIGYAACHWCHVMERESFRDPTVAAMLNAHFVAIKVDREERPDVDALYMDALVQLTGDGGWPANLFLTPDRAPFQGGTYYPPYFRYGTPAFRDVLERVRQAWDTGRSSTVDLAARTLETLGAALPLPEDAPAAPELDLAAPVHGTVAALLETYDHRSGGWGGGARFPHAPRLELLLATGVAQGWRDHRHEDPVPAAALDVVRHQLEVMDRGGIHDQLVGGFHRYTVDEDWVVPHFEKMLYDNAQLARLYLRAGSALGVQRWLTVGCRTLEYMLAELRDGDGLLWSSQDADVDGVEGASYTWNLEELVDALGPAEAARFGPAHGVTRAGNFEGGTSVLVRPGDGGLMSTARGRLERVRAARPAPAVDDKVVVAWNGMALSALCAGAALVGDPRYLAAALRLGARLAEACAVEPLPRLIAAGDRAVAPGVLEDHAHLAEGFLDLHELTGAPSWLELAHQRCVAVFSRFVDAATGDICQVPVDRGDLPVQRVQWPDGAEPSGAGTALLVAVRLAALGAPGVDVPLLDRCLRRAGRVAATAPGTCSTVMRAWALYRQPLRTVVIAGAAGEPAVRDLREVALRPWRPDCGLASVSPSDGAPAGWDALVGKDRPGAPRAYLCEGASCRPPIATPRALAAALADSGGAPPTGAQSPSVNSAPSGTA